MYGEELHPGEHPPLIEESTYRAAQAILAGTSRVVRWTGTLRELHGVQLAGRSAVSATKRSGVNPDYVLRSLVRCALCGEMMCPGSTTKPSTGKTHRYYRCSRREKYGKDQCAGRPLPAAALEEFVVARISNATADGTLAERVAAHLETLTAGEGEDFGKLRAAPPDRPEPVRRPAKVAQQLALAHHLEAAIERGLVADQAALARKLGLTRARVAQLFDLLMLAADLQEQVLALEAVDGAEPMAERTWVIIGVLPIPAEKQLGLF